MGTNPWLDRIRIRMIEKQDLPALEWEGEFTHYRRIYAEAFERFRTGRSVLWIADIPDRTTFPGPFPANGMLGQLFVQLICDRPELADGVSKGYIYAFRIRPTFRGIGLGSRMLEIAEKDLSRRRYTRATLNVGQENVDARRLYERRGYRVVAPDPGRWSFQDEKGSWHFIEEPAWRMEKKL